MCEVHQFTGPGLLVAVWWVFAYRQAGGLIDTLQRRHVVTDQHPADSRASHTKVVADAVGPPPVGEP